MSKFSFHIKGVAAANKETKNLLQVDVANQRSPEGEAPDGPLVTEPLPPLHRLQGKDGDDGSNGATQRVSAEDQVSPFVLLFGQKFLQWELFGSVVETRVKFSVR